MNLRKLRSLANRKIKREKERTKKERKKEKNERTNYVNKMPEVQGYGDLNA